MAAPRILVTGATGLIGRQALPALAAAGFVPLALSRSGRPLPGAAESLAADLRDPAAMAGAVRAAGASHLLHLAWAGGPERMRTPENLDWAGATLALLRAFAAAGGRHAVLAGSSAEYDWTDPSGRFSEDAALRPASLYGAAKAATGTLAMAAAPALGLGVAVARIFFVYGPGEPAGRLLGDLLAGLRAGRPVPCTDGRQRRDYLAAADAAAALAHLAARGVTGPVNVGSGTAVAVGELVATLARLMGRPDLPRPGARARPPGDPPLIEADTTRLAATGFRPRFAPGPAGLAAGLAELLAAEGLAAGAATGVPA
jgi:nucleoside-diphosphate-sugar epimerase